MSPEYLSKYAAAMLPDYWVIDRRERLLRQYQLRGDLLAEAGCAGDQGTAELRFHGRTVGLDLGILFSG